MILNLASCLEFAERLKKTFIKRHLCDIKLGVLLRICRTSLDESVQDVVWLARKKLHPFAVVFC